MAGVAHDWACLKLLLDGDTVPPLVQSMQGSKGCIEFNFWPLWQALLVGGGLASAALQVAAIYVILSLILRTPIKSD